MSIVTGGKHGVCYIESLENRTLFAGFIANLFVGDSAFQFDTLRKPVVPPRLSINVNGAVQGDPSNGWIQPYPRGSVDARWYGGKFIANYVLNNFGGFTATIPLNVADAGDPIPSGPYKGAYVLDFDFLGDGHYGPTHVFSATDFSAVSAPGFTFGSLPIHAFFVGLVPADNKLAFIHSPDNAAVNGVMNPPVTVQILDKDGVPVTSANDTVSLALTGGDPTAKLLGTTSVSAVGGVATFRNLSIDKPGNYQVIASSNKFTSIYSSRFTITEAKLAFLNVPSGGEVDKAINPAIKVALQDGDGNTLTNDSSTVITLNPVGFSGNKPVTGNQATLVNGVATFTNLKFGQAGFYQLRASDGVHASDTTGKFKIGGDVLVLRTQPTSVDVNTAFPLTVAIVDSKGNIDKNATSQVQLSLNPVIPGTGAKLEGTITASFVNGIASFVLPKGPSIDTPGRYTLTITEVENSTGVLTPTETTDPIISKEINVNNYHLAFTRTIKSTDVGKRLDFAVAIQDSKSRTNTKINGHHVQLTLTKVKEGDGGILSDFTELGFVAGVQNFKESTAPSINVPGFYTITATEVDANGVPNLNTAPVTSAVFKITGYRVVFLTQPKSIQSANLPIPFKIALEDKDGHILTKVSDLKVTVESPLIPFGSVYTFKNGVIEFYADFEGTRPIVIDKLGTTQLTISLEDGVSVLGSDSAHIAGAVSRVIQVLPRKLVFLQQPQTATDGGPLKFEVGLLTATGKLQKLPADKIKLSVNSSNGESIGWDSPVFVNGRLSSLDKYTSSGPGRAVIRGGPGTFTITATYDSIVTSQVLPVTSRSFKVFPRRLTFLHQPSNATAGSPLPSFRLGQIDFRGDPIPDLKDGLYFVALRISYRPVSGGANSATTLLGTFNQHHPDDLITGFQINTPGTYVLIAEELESRGGVALPITSKPFRVR